MPVIIKSLQSISFAVSCEFGELKLSKPGSKCGKNKSDKEHTRRIANDLAAEIPGYLTRSSKYTVSEADATTEQHIMEADSELNASTCKSIDLCKRLGKKLHLSKKTQKVTNRTKQR